MIGQKDDPEVAVLTYSEVDHDRYRVFCQMFVYLLDGRVLRLACVLVE